jgi:hypothetical protein
MGIPLMKTLEAAGSLSEYFPDKNPVLDEEQSIPVAVEIKGIPGKLLVDIWCWLGDTHLWRYEPAFQIFELCHGYAGRVIKAFKRSSTQEILWSHGCGKS